MNLIVLLLLISTFFEGYSQLVHHPSFLPILQDDINTVEPYEIQSIKSTVVGEKQTKIKPEEFIETQINEKSPQKSVKNNYPRQRIKYKNNISHLIDKPTVHIDTEKAIIDYVKNDTIATQKHLLQRESMIIKHSNDDTNLFDFPQSNEYQNDKSIDEKTYNTRRIITNTNNLPFVHDLETYVDDDLFKNNQEIEFKKGNAKEGQFSPDESSNNKYQRNENLKSSSSSTLDDLNDKIDDRCANIDDNEILERTDNEIFNENLRKNMPTNGLGITDLVKSRMMLFNHPRVCYACNSILDQSCWSPNRTTSVKYCRQDHHACLIKIYQPRGKTVVIRDCGESCSSVSTVESGEAYASCTICESDLCNSAEVLAIRNIVIILIVATNIIFKIS